MMELSKLDKNVVSKDNKYNLRCRPILREPLFPNTFHIPLFHLETWSDCKAVCP